MEYQTAQQRVKELKSFYKNCMWFGIVALFIFTRRFVKYGDFTEAISTGSMILTIWGIIIAVKAVKLFVLNSEWEEKVLQNEINKSKKPINF
ncbi:2TM domain-containing protein [Chryseobacterium foetidum]|uniref:2TM domain-containing protein n=1 Tax=Chryseobacterium foetidum TaxID=2951057 RepID=UPI0021C62902|nr:2TM domain-containing protein [Chryseobacterium foetidum]